MGGLDHKQWRCTNTPFGLKNLAYCIDGDLVEMFLELDDESQAKIADSVSTELHSSLAPQFLIDYLQDIRSKHSLLCSQQTHHAVHSKNPIFVKSSLNCASFSASMHRLPLTLPSFSHPNVRLGPASTPWKPQIALNSVIESTPSPYLLPA